MKYPKRIDVCPIVDAIIEIRFDTKIYANAVFGVLYNSLEDRFPKVEKLPILQLPEQLRDADPKLMYSPHYKATNGKFQIQIGPKVFTVSSPIPYVGWSELNELLLSCYETIFALNVITKVTRLGIRYINFFELDIFNKINFALTLNNAQHIPINTNIRTQLSEDDFLVNLQIANNAMFEDKPGSILDLDTFKEYGEGYDFKDNIQQELNKCHEIEKGQFFSLLDEKFLKSLQPIY